MGWGEEGAVIGAVVEQDADWGVRKSRLVEHGVQ